MKVRLFLIIKPEFLIAGYTRVGVFLFSEVRCKAGLKVERLKATTYKSWLDIAIVGNNCTFISTLVNERLEVKER